MARYLKSTLETMFKQVTDEVWNKTIALWEHIYEPGEISEEYARMEVTRGHLRPIRMFYCQDVMFGYYEIHSKKKFIRYREQPSGDQNDASQ